MLPYQVKVCLQRRLCRFVSLFFSVCHHSTFGCPRYGPQAWTGRRRPTKALPCHPPTWGTVSAVYIYNIYVIQYIPYISTPGNEKRGRAVEGVGGFKVGSAVACADFG